MYSVDIIVSINTTLDIVVVLASLFFRFKHDFLSQNEKLFANLLLFFLQSC